MAILEFDKSWEVHGSQLKLATTDDDLGAMDGSTPADCKSCGMQVWLKLNDNRICGFFP